MQPSSTQGIEQTGIIIVLDTGVLSELVHKNAATRDRVQNFLRSLSAEIVIPGIADYELRRALLKINSTTSLQILDSLIDVATYEPVTTAILHRAAEIWADCRKNHRPFCDDARLDGDCIIIAHAQALGPTASVLTKNVKDIGQYVQVQVLP